MNATTPPTPPAMEPLKFDSATMITQEESGLVASWPLPASTSSITLDPLRLAIKRVIDLTGAIVGLTLFAPLMLAIALTIRMNSDGPVLFRQLRRGHRGQSFWVLKYRTMTVDAEQRLSDLEKHNESAGGVLFKLKNDPRVTRIGQFLRRTSLDELPQLINVLLGDMSLVGPRPLQIRDSEKLLAENPAAYARRLEVMPGLTGPWQIGGRSELDHLRMVELDIEYAKNWSLTKDLVILFKTPFAVVLRRGAY